MGFSRRIAAERLDDGGKGQKHGFRCRPLLERSLHDFEFDEAITDVVVLRSRLRVHDNADTAQSLTKFNRDREHGAHEMLSDTLSLGAPVDRQPSEPEN